VEVAHQEARHRFREQLASLEVAALGALDIVVEQMDRALEALEQRDSELASFVIADDERIDGRYLEVHQGILSLLALQAPVAGDLRVVAALLHVIKHAERMGDQCVNIAKLIPLVGNEPPVVPELLEKVLRMGAATRAEVIEAKLAFKERELALARDLARQDREVNRLNKEVFHGAVAAGDDPDRREWAMVMTMVARALERIGDNAVGVGEQVIFVETGLFKKYPIEPLPEQELADGDAPAPE
jgi:phosphate transport system protein